MKEDNYYYIEFKSKGKKGVIYITPNSTMLIDSGKFKVVQILNSNQNDEKVYLLKSLKKDNYREVTDQEIKRFIELYYF